jgi:hypothetical protein
MERDWLYWDVALEVVSPFTGTKAIDARCGLITPLLELP